MKREQPKLEELTEGDKGRKYRAVFHLAKPGASTLSAEGQEVSVSGRGSLLKPLN